MQRQDDAGVGAERRWRIAREQDIENMGEGQVWGDGLGHDHDQVMRLCRYLEEKGNRNSSQGSSSRN